MFCQFLLYDLLSAPYDVRRVFCSLDGHPLPIKQLKGMEAIEIIDLSRQGLTVLPAIVIGSLISSNSVTKTLKYAAPFAWPFVRQRPMTVDCILTVL